MEIAFPIPKSHEMRVRLDKIKFKKGLLSRSRKVTGKIDLKLCKITSKSFSQIIFQIFKTNQTIKLHKVLHLGNVYYMKLCQLLAIGKKI